MARDEYIDRLLREWAQYRMVGDGSGYPRTSMLHPEWQPPAKGQTPSLKVGHPSRVREVDRAIRELSERLQSTLWLYYCTQLPIHEQAVRLACQPDTIHKRLSSADTYLRGVLCAPA